MKKYILLILSTLCFSDEINTLYQQALEYEERNDYQNAMILYKKIAQKNLLIENKYLIDKSKDDFYETQSIDEMKKSFYNRQINKVEDKETNESLSQIISGNFGLYPYEKNYLIPVSYDFKKSDDRNQWETTYQISVEKPISYNFFGLNESISVAYTQKSFWQTSEDSSPFRETNYRPELFVMFPYENSETLKGYKFSILHESNGRNNEYSRSWNRLYAEAYLQLTNLFIIPKVWYRLKESSLEDDNPDIEDYYGYGDLTLFYAHKKHTFELKTRNNLKFDENNRTSFEFNWAFPLPKLVSSSNSYGLIQIFKGYGNSLIDYNRNSSRVGFGIAFSR